jgi:hypothetical protein
MFLIDKHGQRPVCVSCHKLGPYMDVAPDVFVCQACTKAADEHIRLQPRFQEGLAVHPASDGIMEAYR